MCIVLINKKSIHTFIALMHFWMASIAWYWFFQPTLVLDLDKLLRWIWVLWPVLYLWPVRKFQTVIWGEAHQSANSWPWGRRWLIGFFLHFSKDIINNTIEMPTYWYERSAGFLLMIYYTTIKFRSCALLERGIDKYMHLKTNMCCQCHAQKGCNAHAWMKYLDLSRRSLALSCVWTCWYQILESVTAVQVLE